MRNSLAAAIGLGVLAAAGLAVAQTDSIINTPHNLSASGPGAIRATQEQQICIFCHTPHNAAPIQPLWNRHEPVGPYRIYSSRSLQALPGQPTGSSKLCLSCHDGTIALGNVLSRSQPITMTGGITTLPPTSPARLGTDLSGDHPISFRYDTLLTSRNTKLKNPVALPTAVKLDRNHELQCTSCHDAHSNRYGNFLVMANNNSELCNTCHQLGTTQIAQHQNCAGCHQPHTAPSGPYLLRGQTVRDTCLVCHGGTPNSGLAANIAPDLGKASAHDTRSPVDLANPIPNNVGCADCHGPHSMASSSASAPQLPANFGQVSGVSAAGAAVSPARYEYEVCFKCHADQSASRPFVTRQLAQTNTRLQFSPSSISFHPVEAAGKNANVPSLMPGWNTSSLVYCNDCHNSNTGKKAGGSGANGGHGSDFQPLLIARYETTDRTTESANTYALCYRCHDRNSILGDRSFPKHKEHVVDQRTPCSVCHDAHGISSAQGAAINNTHLINFDTTVVTPERASKRLEFQDRGQFHGACYLNCHGQNHAPKTY